MQDRISLYPGRVTLTPVPGQENTYDMVRSDQPFQEGTPLNKANLLSDEVAAAIGALTGGDAPETPSEALSLLRGLIANGVKIETGSYVGTNTYGSANKNSITLSFSPKIMFVAHADTRSYSNSGVIMVYTNVSAPKSTSISLNAYSSDTAYIVNTNAEISETTISWYSNSTTRQMNEAKKYDYIAIGVGE